MNDKPMYTVIETIHNDNGTWTNIRTECQTIEEATLIAMWECADTSNVEILDANFKTVKIFTPVEETK